MKILYPGGINWTFMKQRPQIFMEKFAERGHESHFLSNDAHIDGARKITDSFMPRNDIPLHIHKYNIGAHNLDWDTMYYTYPPVGIKTLRRNNPKFIIFDSLDEPLEGVFHYWNEDGAYYKSLEVADLVLTTSESLYKIASSYADEVLKVPNATNFTHYQNRMPKPKEYGEKPVVLYMGALASWMNKELVKKMAVNLPDYDFIFVGPAMNFSFPNPPENLKFLGHKDYNELPAYVQHSNVCIIPFKPENPEINSCDPIKCYEYLSCGKPVVTTAMPETKNKPGVFWSKNDQDFINNIVLAVNEQPSDKEIERRILFAKDNSWDARVDLVLKRVEELT